MEEREFAGVVAGASKAAQDAPALMIENPQHLVAGVDDIHVFLPGIARKGDVQSRPDRFAPGRSVRRRRIGGSRFDVDDAFHAAGLVEDFDPVVAAVADIEQPLAIKLGAMGMASANDSKETAIRPGVAPLAQELALGVEDDDAMVAIAVGAIDIAVVRIDCDVGGFVEKQRALVGAGLAAFFVRMVADAFAPDLQQQLLAVMRPFLHDPIGAAADPDVILLVDEAAMD